MTGTEPSGQLRQRDAVRLLLDYSLDMITILARDGRVLHESASAARASDGSTAGRAARSIFDRVHTDDLSRTLAAIDRACEAAEPVGPFHYRVRHADGTWRTLEAVARSMTGDAGERVCVMSARDVTGHLMVDEQVVRVQKMEALERLARSIAHDFNNVLTAILGNVDLALADDPPERLRPRFSEIRDAAVVATSLVEQLQLFSQRRLTRTDVIDVCDSVGHMEAMLRRMLNPGVRLVVSSTISGPAHVSLAHGSLEQIVMNLVVNARDAMPDGGQIDVTIDRSAIATAEDGSRDFVTLRVADSGVGMTPQVRARVFEPYFTTKAVGKGRGLGLATVYGIVTDAGGSIDLLTAPGRGTTVAVHLPRALPQT